ncbi:MAG TPA: 4'-phosphopantetheinyl transferase superfamily protein [Kiritimatiellia bacterium]|nr:4'-phosphopantetheinyl transferase superfamily protein [Kiritimatiellia bacterium]
MILGPTSWRASTPFPELRPGHTYLWRTRLLATESDLHRARAILTPEEIQRADRLIHPARGRLQVLSFAFLRSTLAACLRCPPSSLHFATGPHGKPHLIDSPLHFNLSHTSDLALLAVTLDTPHIGVDIEAHGPRASRDIASRFFSPREQRDLEACPDFTSGFFSVWTRKEAFIKALGLGLACPLHTFDVSVAPAPAALLDSRIDDQPPSAWHMADLIAFDQTTAALCQRAPLTNLIAHTWTPDLIG